MPDESAARVRWRWWFLGVAVVGNVLNVAGIADAVLEWRSFFQHIVTNYVEFRRFAFSLLPFQVPESIQPLLVSAALTLFVILFAMRGSWNSLKGMPVWRWAESYDVLFGILAFVGFCTLALAVLSGAPIVEWQRAQGAPYVIFWLLVLLSLASFGQFGLMLISKHSRIRQVGQRFFVAVAMLGAALLLVAFLFADFKSGLATQ